MIKYLEKSYLEWKYSKKGKIKNCSFIGLGLTNFLKLNILMFLFKLYTSKMNSFCVYMILPALKYRITVYHNVLLSF